LAQVLLLSPRFGIRTFPAEAGKKQLTQIKNEWPFSFESIETKSEHLQSGLTQIGF